MLFMRIKVLSFLFLFACMHFVLFVIVRSSCKKTFFKWFKIVLMTSLILLLAALVNLLWFLDFVGWLSFWYIFLFLYKRPFRVWIFSFIVKDINILSKYINQLIVLYGRWHKYFNSAWYLQPTLNQRWDTIISWSRSSKNSRTSIK